MLKILKFVCVVLIVSGCKREYAHFQKTISDNYHKPKKQAANPTITQDDPTDETFEEIEILTRPDDEFAAQVSVEAPVINNLPKQQTDLFPKGLFKKKKTATTKNKKNGLFQKQEKKEVIKKKKKKKRRDSFGHNFNERLKIGLVLLGIAIIFALLHINILAIIFGVLSAFFIIRGLRKLF